MLSQEGFNCRLLVNLIFIKYNTKSKSKFLTLKKDINLHVVKILSYLLPPLELYCSGS